MNYSIMLKTRILYKWNSSNKGEILDNLPEKAIRINKEGLIYVIQIVSRKPIKLFDEKINTKKITMKKSINQLKDMNLRYLAHLDSYDILNNKELMWLLSSNVEEERIIAALLLRDRQVENLEEIFSLHTN